MSRPLLDWFPLLLGAYVGGLAAAVVGFSPGITVLGWQVITAGAVAFAGTVAVAATRDHLAVELARTDWNLAVVVAPFLLLLGSVDLLARDGSTTSMGTLLILAVAVLGLAVYVVANRRVIEWARDADAVVVQWTAGTTARRRRWLRATLLGGGLAFIVAGFVLHHPFAEIAPTMGTVTLVFELFAGRAREYSVLPDGLYVQHPGTFAGQFVSGQRLTGYRVTDDALVIDRWIPLLAFTSRLEDIDDLDAVTDVLDRAFESSDDRTTPDRGLSDTD
ncbi:hypothetical protein BV210_13665 [Halorientalis sp. IM1011]|uniref:hypothetical protein n=1 Tax=Halorientalis sp. IM1011 TaxID=1932360 RepID=UPI00097CC1A9|nr:hypothetical protein [Halorientalis sp. IM1011]AQL43685.1 hypothetical protein BV210_13665 [Halorientalis sp. IM1011]